MEYKKDFDKWNILKKNLEKRSSFPFVSTKEIWWCALGVNIGIEIDGKNENFERPVLIIKAYNTEMIKIIPLTTSTRDNKYYFKIKKITFEGKMSYAVLSQVRTISAKRLLRKIGGKILKEDFNKIKIMLTNTE